MQVGVVALTGGGDVAYDLFVLDAPQRHDGQPQRIDQCGRPGCFAAVARSIPAQRALRRVVAVVVERRRDGVVEVVGVEVGDAERTESFRPARFPGLFFGVVCRLLGLSGVLCLAPGRGGVSAEEDEQKESRLDRYHGGGIRAVFREERDEENSPDILQSN